jgi:hypothetical protein
VVLLNAAAIVPDPVPLADARTFTGPKSWMEVEFWAESDGADMTSTRQKSRSAGMHIPLMEGTIEPPWAQPGIAGDLEAARYERKFCDCGGQ